MQKRSTATGPLTPVGVKLATRRKPPRGTYDKKLKGWINGEDDSVTLATWITDPEKKEWDD